MEGIGKFFNILCPSVHVHNKIRLNVYVPWLEFKLYPDSFKVTSINRETTKSIALIYWQSMTKGKAIIYLCQSVISMSLKLYLRTDVRLRQFRLTNKKMLEYSLGLMLLLHPTCKLLGLKGKCTVKCVDYSRLIKFYEE